MFFSLVNSCIYPLQMFVHTKIVNKSLVELNHDLFPDSTRAIYTRARGKHRVENMP